MDKIIMTRTMVAEFEFNQEDWTGGTTIENAAKMDCENTDAWGDLFNCKLKKDEVSYETIVDEKVTSSGKFSYE